ncbi:MAG: hypothetical protein ABSF47_00860 [Minisyncoccia bacterium]|jgi:hypothetical protein
MTLNYEARNLEEIDLNKALDRAELKSKEKEIKLDEFIGSPDYTTEEIANDKDFVVRKEKEFAERNGAEGTVGNRLNTLFKVIVNQQSEAGNLFGGDASAVNASRFDKIKNGVDTVVEFEKEPQTVPSYLALGIDVTLSTDTVEQQFNRVKQEIESGQLTQVKYFVSKNTPPQKLPHIPRVIIGAEAKTIRELGELWLAGDKKALGNHWIQLQILEEAVIELKTFRRHAENLGKKEIVEIYDRDIGILEKIYGQKLKERQERGLTREDKDERDNVFYGIASQLRRF